MPGGAVRVLGRLGKALGGASARGAGYCTVATCTQNRGSSNAACRRNLQSVRL